MGEAFFCLGQGTIPMSSGEMERMQVAAVVELLVPRPPAPDKGSRIAGVERQHLAVCKQDAPQQEHVHQKET